jgi:hypothetical protein
VANSVNPISTTSLAPQKASNGQNRGFESAGNVEMREELRAIGELLGLAKP